MLNFIVQLTSGNSTMVPLLVETANGWTIANKMSGKFDRLVLSANRQKNREIPIVIRMGIFSKKKSGIKK